MTEGYLIRKETEIGNLGGLILLAHSALLVSDALLAHSSVLNVCKRLVARSAAGDILHLLEGNSGYEALGLPGLGDLAVELVDLFQGESLGLVDHEVNEYAADTAEPSPDPEDVGVDSGSHVGCRICNGPVEQPVGGGSHRERLGSDLQGEDLTSDDPCTRSPRAGKEEDVDADERDESLLGGLVGDRHETDSSNDKLTNGHTDGSEEQELSSTPLLDQVQTREGGGDIDARSDQTDGETITDSRILEERRSIIEDEVDTAQLLESLKTTTGSEALAEVALKAIDVAGLAEGHFVFVVGGDFSQLGFDGRVIDRKTSQFGERASSFLVLALLDVESRGLGKNQQPTEQDDCPGELNSDGNAV